VKTKILFFLVPSLILVGAAGAQSTYRGGGGGASASPQMALTDTIYVAVGRELNIWSARLGPTPFENDPFFYEHISDVGWTTNRAFRYLPAAVGDDLLTIKARNYGLNLAETKTVYVSAVDSIVGTGEKKLLFVGDSLIDGASDVVPAEVDSLFGADGGGDAVCIGTQSYSGVVFHEGRGGWTWERYTTDYAGNPFWDTGRIDFQAYSTNDLGGLEPDYVIVNLGLNEAANAAIAGQTLDTAAVIASATAFLDTIFNATYGYPDCRVLINLEPASAALRSSFGVYYGSLWSSGLYFSNVRSLMQAYLTAFDGGAYSNRVDVVNGDLWVDPIYGYPTIDAAISARYTTQEPYGTNFLHPDANGSKQMADAIYSHLRHWHGIDVVVTACTNELTDSHNWESTAWSGVNAAITVTSGQADPWAGTSASRLTSATGTASIFETHIPPIAFGASTSLVASVFIKDYNMASGQKTFVRSIGGAGAFGQAVVSWNGSGVATISAGECGGTGDLAGDVTWGLTDEGGGWYQLYVAVDLTSTASTTFDCRLGPWGTGTTTGQGIIATGAQLELDVTEPCGTYIEKP
jgi:hypothetical protein